MTKSLSLRHASYLCCASLLTLGACSLGEIGPDSEYKAGSAEEILAAEGEWKLVEEKRSPSPIQKHMETREKVHPAQSLKSKNYTEDAQSMHVNDDIHFRVLRLERQMDTVQSDLNVIKPKLALLPEKKLKIKTQMQPTKKAAIGGPLRVLNVRLGQHPGKTRFVMDISAASTFSYDLDNGEHLLLIELPATSWESQAQKTLKNNALIKAYSVQTSNGTSRLAIELKKSVKVLMAKTYSPNHVHGHRIVFDLSGL